jgi:hypothetical protein
LDLWLELYVIFNWRGQRVSWFWEKHVIMFIISCILFYIPNLNLHFVYQLLVIFLGPYIDKRLDFIVINIILPKGWLGISYRFLGHWGPSWFGKRRALAKKVVPGLISTICMFTLLCFILPPFNNQWNIDLMIVIRFHPRFPYHEIIAFTQIIHGCIFRTMKFIIVEFIIKKLLRIWKFILPFRNIIRDHILSYRIQNFALHCWPLLPFFVASSNMNWLLLELHIVFLLFQKDLFIFLSYGTCKVVIFFYKLQFLLIFNKYIFFKNLLVLR